MDVILYLCAVIACFAIRESNCDYSIDDTVGIGRRFDGIGAISGGGPNFGASLQIFKVEIGGDDQSSEGTEASHQHESWDENYNRGYEWWLMKEAKKRNPSIQLYGLPWSFPGWLGGSSHWWPYVNNSRLADYIVNWVQGARDVHGLNIDYVGIWNEKPYDKEYVKVLRKRLDARGFDRVQIVVADLIGADSWDVVDDLTDKEFFNSVSIVGGHYTGTSTTDQAQNCGKPLWSSEDVSSYDDETGGGCLARLINQNYVNGLMTSTIVWNMLAAYYDDLPYSRASIMTANQPWSGYFEVNSPVWAAAHTTQFTKIGWNYLLHSHGVGWLDNGGTFVSITSPDLKQMTIVIETMDLASANFCLRPPQTSYKVLPQNATFKLGGSFVSIKHFRLWQSHLGLGKLPSSLFEDKGLVSVINGQISLKLDTNSIYTLTTLLDAGFKGSPTTAKKPAPFPLPYHDDFESYTEVKEPFNFAPQVGVFEIVPSGDKIHGNVMRQTLLSPPIYWCPVGQQWPVNVIGDFKWSDVNITADVRVSNVNATSSVFLATRVDQGGCTAFLAQGIYLFLYPSIGRIELYSDVARTVLLYRGSAPIKLNQWSRISLSTQANTTSVIIDGIQMYRKQISQLTSSHGFIALGTGDFGLADFDNILIDHI